jgi:hypothetical protein
LWVRAHVVAEKVDLLNIEYRTRADEILGDYNKRYERWKREKVEYERTTAAYNAWHELYGRSSSFSTLNSLLGLRSSEPSPFSATMPPVAYSSSSVPGPFPLSSPALSGTVLQMSEPSPPPPEPSPPSTAPGPMPEPLVISVDKEWKLKMDRVQQEASAIWEAAHHNLGDYPSMFPSPSTYVADDELKKQAARLRELADRLH